MNLLELKKADGSEAWKSLAAAVGTSVAYLSQVANGHRNASVKLARKLAAANPKLSVEEILRLHADDQEAA